MSDIRFETSTLRRGGQELSATADQLMAEFQTLSGSAPAWGADDVSGLCQMAYEAIVQVVTDSIDGVSTGWQEHSGLLVQAADAYDATEQANAAAGSSVRSNL